MMNTLVSTDAYKVTSENTIEPESAYCSQAATTYCEIMNRLLKNSGYTVNEIRGIWRRGYKDFDSLTLICELLNTRREDVVSYFLSVDPSALKRRVEVTR